MRCWLVLAGLVVSAAVAEARQRQPAVLPLVVNDVPRGDVPAIIDGTDVWLQVSDLNAAGVYGFLGRREILNGTPHVLLSTLQPDITFRLDMADVVVYVVADPRFYDENRVVLQLDRPAGLVNSRSASGFLNYSATWDQAAGTTGFGEAGLSWLGQSLLTGFSVDADGSLIRGLSTLTLDRPSARQRWQFGDTIPRSMPLGSAPIVAGVSFGREYSIDPYYYRYPTPIVRGTAASPSDVEVYINGSLVRRLRIGPGPYRFDRLPLTSGLGDVRVVVRDPLGRQQVFDASVYLATGVLTRGEQDYQYVAGVLRDDSSGQPVYGDLQGIASHRTGLTDWLTVGLAGEGNTDVVSAGPSMAVRAGRLGELELHGWSSRTAEKQNGFAGYAVYTFVSRRLNLSALAQYYGPGFANIFLAPGEIQTPELYQGNIGVPVRDSGSVTYTFEQRRSPAATFGFELPDGQADTEIVRSRAHTVRTSMRLLPKTQFTATATHTDVRGQSIWSGYAGLTLILGPTTTASAAYSTFVDGNKATTADITRSLPVGVGYGFRVSGADGSEDDTASGQFELNTPSNQLRLNYDAFANDDRTNAAVTLAGAVVASGGALFASRPLDTSAAVVEVTGLRNVRIYADNVEVARTNRGGKALVPRLLPYLGNRISFEETDIPFEFKVPISSQLIAPPFRGAAFVKFETTRIHARAGRIVLLVGDQEVVPSYGTIVADTAEGTVESPLNADGEFFLDLPAGSHPATVTYKGQSCRLTLVGSPDVTTLIEPLGTLRCTP